MSAVQTADHIMMVEPVSFCANPQTLESNAFQHEGEGNGEAEDARQEARNLRNLLVQRGVMVTGVRGHEESPDDLFCNNWISTHQNGRMVLYPMAVPNRRKERRPELIKILKQSYPDIWDFTAAENEGKALESTGSLVLDRINKIAYAAVSSRTDPDLVREWALRMGYEPVLFPAVDKDGQPVYHTNVIMFMGTTVAGLCAESIPDIALRQQVVEKIRETHELILLSMDQIYQFCGNMLEVKTLRGERVMVMSESAFNALTADQKGILANHVDGGLLHAPIPTIERLGGGSVRCMMLELF